MRTVEKTILKKYISGACWLTAMEQHSFNVLSSNRQPCHTHGDLQAMQHSHQSQPRFWSWEGWSLIEKRQRSTWLSIPVTNLFLCRRDTDRFLRQCWSFDVWCFNQPPMGDHHWLGSPYDLFSGHRPQALRIQTIKKTTLYSKIKYQGWSNFPKTSENGNHKDQTNNFSDFPREQKQTNNSSRSQWESHANAGARNMLVTEEMRFPQIPKAPLAKSGYLLHGRQRPSNASQISCKI